MYMHMAPQPKRDEKATLMTGASANIEIRVSATDKRTRSAPIGTGSMFRFFLLALRSGPAEAEQAVQRVFNVPAGRHNGGRKKWSTQTLFF
jgi:hypothetical protein